MADRRCPSCGELVPSTSITCPKCFRKIPNDPEPVRRDAGGEGRPQRPVRRNIALLLSLVPGLVGLLGLGLIYTDPRRRRGYVALAVGFLVFVAAILLTLGVVSVFLAVPFWILYSVMYLGCLFLTVAGDIRIRTF